MSDNTILAIAQSGIQNGMTGLKKNAAALASKDFLQPEGPSLAEGSLPTQRSAQTQAASVTNSSATDELVGMKMNEYQVLASGKVIEAVDEMLGSLLDEKA